MSKNYDWGTQPSQDSHGWGTPTGKQMQQPRQPKQLNSGALKKVGVTAAALVGVVAVGVVGFQVFKFVQSPADNPDGLTAQQARDFIINPLHDCELPEEFLETAGIGEFQEVTDHDGTTSQEKTECSGWFVTEDGSNEYSVTMTTGGGNFSTEESGWKESRIEGWHETIKLSDWTNITKDEFLSTVPASVDEILESDSSVDWYSNAEGTFDNGIEQDFHNDIADAQCVLRSTLPQYADMTLATLASCEHLYPLAASLTNAVKQDESERQKTGFFELKEDPDYIRDHHEMTPTVRLLSDWDTKFAEAADLGATVPSQQKGIEGSEVTAHRAYYASSKYNADDQRLCFDLTYLHGESDDKRRYYYLPDLALIYPNGAVIDVTRDMAIDSQGSERLKAGDSLEYQVCTSSEYGASQIRHSEVLVALNDKYDKVRLHWKYQTDDLESHEKDQV